ncbi:MAG: radical SAM protein [Bacteroidota bacterium]
MNKIILFYPLVDKNRQIPNLPFSVLNLERMLRDNPVEVIVIDERIQPDYFSIIDSNRNDLILAGVSVMIGYQMISGKKFSAYIKENTNAGIVWGGWFPNVLPEIALSEKYVDYIIHGQGEYPFRKLVLALLNNELFENIEGLGYKKNEEIFINELHPVVNENEFPLIDFTKIDINKIIEINGAHENSIRSLNYIATIGCPYNCTFCCLTTIWGQKTFSKDVATIIADLELFTKNYRVFKISFDDDHFFGNRSFVIELCNQIIDKNIIIEWEANAHIGTFLKNYSADDLKIIYRAGCRSIRFGAESGDQGILDRIRKKTTVQNCIDVAKLLKLYNIKCVMYIMVAFPWDPDKDFSMTLDLISKVKLINKSLEVGINFFVPLPKTPLYEESIKYGFQKFESFDQITQFISNTYTAPWWKRNYRKELHDFIWLYFKYSNPGHYKSKDKKIKFIDYVVNKLFYPLCYLRLKYNYRKFRIDAKVYFFLKRIFNFITKNKFADDSEAMARSRSWRR